jgi:hypothetical protein
VTSNPARATTKWSHLAFFDFWSRWATWFWPFSWKNAHWTDSGGEAPRPCMVWAHLRLLSMKSHRNDMGYLCRLPFPAFRYFGRIYSPTGLTCKDNDILSFECTDSVSFARLWSISSASNQILTSWRACSDRLAVYPIINADNLFEMWFLSSATGAVNVLRNCLSDPAKIRQVFVDVMLRNGMVMI